MRNEEWTFNAPASCSRLLPPRRSSGNRSTTFQFMRAARKIESVVVLVFQPLEFRAQRLLGQSCQSEMDRVSRQMKRRVPRLFQYVGGQIERRANFRRRGWLTICCHLFHLDFLQWIFRNGLSRVRCFQRLYLSASVIGPMGDVTSNV